MSDFTGHRPEDAASGPMFRSELIQASLSTGLPAHPVSGSSLDALVRRQSSRLDIANRLGFVPAQVR